MKRAMMNYDDCDESEKRIPEEKECKCYPRCCEKEIILNCGTVTGSVPLTCSSNLGGRAVAVGSEFQPEVQAAVVLDTNGLIKPTVKIDFSSLISFKTGYGSYLLHLTFKLSKVCGGCPVTLGTWTFEKASSESQMGDSSPSPEAPPPQIRESIQEIDPFCFSWCECEECPGCCRYIVELTEQQCYNIEFVTIGNISITGMAAGIKKSVHD